MERVFAYFNFNLEIPKEKELIHLMLINRMFTFLPFSEAETMLH